MTELSPAALIPVAQTHPNCPVCGLPAISAVVRENRGVMLGDYMCAEGTLWFTKWLVAA